MICDLSWDEINVLYIRLRIRVDVRKPLKRCTKICKKHKKEVIVNCKYEKLGDFCFICGLLSHTKRFGQKKFEPGREMINKEWGHWLRAQPRRAAGGGKSKWLREDGDGEWGRHVERDNDKVVKSGFVNTDFGRTDESVCDRMGSTAIYANNPGHSRISLNNFNKGGKGKRYWA